MTMKKPEMEVVRFNESDVIVASGGVTPLSPPLYISAFEYMSDGMMKGNGVDYNQENYYNLPRILYAAGYGDEVQRDPSGTVDNVGTMFFYNPSPDDYSSVATTTGNYYWNPSSKHWEYNYSGQ